MRIKMTDEQSRKSKTAIYISILLAVALCIGVYLISTTVLIARDGITFIEYARELETSPIEAIKSKDQHPGYPLLIAAAHKIANIRQDRPSLQSWIYSAQAVTLAFRLLTVVLLYFAGKKIVGERFSFWAVLILILLPNGAIYGSDVLSDWPHIYFLSAGFLLLIWEAESRKWWMFGFSGLAAGIGYLIRPESTQVVVLGTLWLGVQLFRPQRTISKYKLLLAFALLLAGFLVAAGPYMKLKGAIFPKKQLVHFIPDRQPLKPTQIGPSGVYAASFAPSDIAGAVGKLVQRVGDALMWFFLPALLIGIYKYFRKHHWYEPAKFFVAALIALNVFVMILLYCRYGYMSKRHIQPLVVWTIFYIPLGLDAMALWLNEKFPNKTNTNTWFLVLLVTGIFVCGIKLFLMTPIRVERQSYRDAARWLAQNTNEGDIIAVSDMRIGFYSGRNSIEYNGQIVPQEAKYVVKIFEDEKNTPIGEEMPRMKEVFSAEGKEEKVVIYSRSD